MCEPAGRPASQGLINEWQPPDHAQAGRGPSSSACWRCWPRSALARRRPTLSEVLLVCGVPLAGVGAARATWSGSACSAMPLVAQCLGAQPGAASAGRRPRDAQRGESSRWRWRWRWPRRGRAPAVAEGRAAAAAGLQGFLRRCAGRRRAVQRRHPRGRRRLAARQPCAGPDVQRDGLRLVPDLGALPEAQVFVDPRVELYPLELWQDYLAIAEARDYQRLLSTATSAAGAARPRRTGRARRRAGRRPRLGARVRRRAGRDLPAHSLDRQTGG